eukprot:scaffold110553_cov19-Prasinocladus_malaysianus.AAC.1
MEASLRAMEQRANEAATAAAVATSRAAELEARLLELQHNRQEQSSQAASIHQSASDGGVTNYQPASPVTNKIRQLLTSLPTGQNGANEEN